MGTTEFATHCAQEASERLSARRVRLLPEPLAFGTLRWKHTHGFINTGDEDILCHERDFLNCGLHLDTGDRVQFVKKSGGDRTRAVRICPEEPARVQAGVEGTVTMFRKWDGWGCITCEEYKKLWFAAEDGKLFAQGSPVSFDVHEYDNGDVQAVSVVSCQRDVSGFGGIIRADVLGKIVTWKADRNFGFIRVWDSDEQIYFQGKNVLIPKFGVGMMVEFNMVEMKDLSKCAIDIVMAVVEPKRRATIARPQPRPECYTTLEKGLSGTVVACNEERGFGFVKIRASGAQLHFKLQAEEFKVGDNVTFDLVETWDNRRAAQCVVASRKYLCEMCTNPECQPSMEKGEAFCPCLSNVAPKVARAQDSEGHGRGVHSCLRNLLRRNSI